MLRTSNNGRSGVEILMWLTFVTVVEFCKTPTSNIQVMYDKKEGLSNDVHLVVVKDTK